MSATSASSHPGPGVPVCTLCNATRCTINLRVPPPIFSILRSKIGDEEIQELVIESLAPDETSIEGSSFGAREDLDSTYFTQHLERSQCLYSCGLVCRAWVAPSQRLLFSWAYLVKCTQFDYLYNLSQSSSSSRLLNHIVRISFAYSPPYLKLGEALPRLATMAPPKLKRVDIYADSWPTFPFHASLPAHLSRLRHVQLISLSAFQFTHLAEVRRLIASLRGLRVAILATRVNVDRLGSLRALPTGPNRTTGLTSIFCLSLQDPGLPLAFWLSPSRSSTNLTQSHSGSSPTITPDLAELLEFLHPPIADGSGFYELWSWARHSTPNNRWSLTSRYDNTTRSVVTRSYTFRVENALSDEPTPPAVTFCLRHLTEIRLEGVEAIEADDNGWTRFSNGIDMILSQHTRLWNLEKMELHLLSAPFRLQSQPSTQAMTEEQWRKDRILRILGMVEPLQECRFDVVVYLDGISLNILLELLEEEALVAPAPLE